MYSEGRREARRETVFRGGRGASEANGRDAWRGGRDGLTGRYTLTGRHGAPARWRFGRDLAAIPVAQIHAAPSWRAGTMWTFVTDRCLRYLFEFNIHRIKKTNKSVNQPSFCRTSISITIEPVIYFLIIATALNNITKID